MARTSGRQKWQELVESQGATVAPSESIPRLGIHITPTANATQEDAKAIGAVMDSWQGLQAAMATTGQAAAARNTFISDYRLSDYTLAGAYRQDWLVRRTIDGPARDMVRAWYDVVSDDDPDGAHELAEVLERWRVKPMFRRALELARLMGGAGIVLGLDDLRTPDQPVNLAALRRISWMRVVDRRYLTVLERETSPEYPGMWSTPTVYSCGSRETGTIARLHASRVIPFYGDPVLEDERDEVDGWGDSALETRWKALAQYQRASQAIAVAAERFTKTLLKTKNLATIMSEPDGQAKILSRVQRLQSLVAAGNVAAIDSEVEELQEMGIPMAGLSELVVELRQNVAAALDMPQSRLFGQQQGTTRTGGDADERTYFDYIKAQQDDDVTPQLRRLCDLIVASREGPTMGQPLDFRLSPRELMQAQPLDAADAALKTANADRVYIDAGVVSKAEVRRERFEGEWSLDESYTMRLDREAGEDSPPDDDPDGEQEIPEEGDPAVEDVDSYRPPSSVASAARRGLALRASMPRSRRGGTAVGVARAVQLSRREPVSRETIGRMVSYFARHSVDRNAPGWGRDSKGWQAWLLWGGDAGRRWAEGILRGSKEQQRDAALPTSYGHRDGGTNCDGCRFRSDAAGRGWCDRHGAVVDGAFGCDDHAAP